MLAAVSKGMSTLPPRAKYGTGNIPNRVKDGNTQAAAYAKEAEK